MHFRDTETSGGGANFKPKSHSAILINAAATYEFKDRQGVSFNVTVNAASLPVLLPISVSELVTASANVVFLA